MKPQVILEFSVIVVTFANEKVKSLFCNELQQTVFNYKTNKTTTLTIINLNL